MKKLLLVLLLGILLVSCADKNPLLGSWFDESSGQMITFEKDSCTFTGQVYDYRLEENKIIMAVDGEEQVYQYAIEDDVLEISFPDIDDFELYFKKVKKNN